MKKGILLLLIVITCCSCITSKYTVIRESELKKIDLDNTATLFVPIADKNLQTSSILDSTCFLIKKKRFLKLEQYIKNQEKNGVDASEVNLSRTLFHLSVNEYIKAFKYVNLINGSDYPLLKQLLSIDLFCEIEKANGTLDYNSYLKKYQALVDNYPDNEWLKKQIALRIRYLRYNN